MAPKDPESDAERRDEASDKARDAELKRQESVVDAVAKANDEDLPKLGGAIRDPGLGR